MVGMLIAWLPATPFDKVGLEEGWHIDLSLTAGTNISYREDIVARDV